MASSGFVYCEHFLFLAKTLIGGAVRREYGKPGGVDGMPAPDAARFGLAIEPKQQLSGIPNAGIPSESDAE